jgi:serine/threonine-protein kinase RsbW
MLIYLPNLNPTKLAFFTYLIIFKLRSMLTIVQQDHLTVTSDLKLQNQVQQWFEKFSLQYLAQEGWSESQLYRLNLALAEGFTNAVRHAHRALPPETKIDIELNLWIDRLEIRIWDYGKPFNPDGIPEPKPGTIQDHGYGWFLIRRVADYVVYERGSDNRNCLLIVKYLLEGQH